MKSIHIFSFFLLIAVSSNFYTAFSQSEHDIKLQLEIQPSEVGKKIVGNIVERRFGWRYQKVCSYYGALIFADAIGDKTIQEQIVKGYAPFYEGKRKYHIGHVDYNVFGIWPFELYRQTGDKKYLEVGNKLADAEFQHLNNDGLTYLTRFWVDDMYMVGSLQVQAYKSIKDKKYLDRAALQLLAYCDSLQRPNGLFFHRNDAPFFWGRGNGWAAAALTELLLVLPPSHKHYDALLKAYQKMMSALLNFQGDDGMWHQLLDDPDSFVETSCTGMFLFALISGVDKGLLPSDAYIDAIEKGWNALASYVNEDGEVREVCMWTNAKNNKNHYLKRRRIDGDFHGQAAVLWASTAMLRFLDNKL